MENDKGMKDMHMCHQQWQETRSRERQQLDAQEGMIPVCVELPTGAVDTSPVSAGHRCRT